MLKKISQITINDFRNYDLTGKAKHLCILSIPLYKDKALEDLLAEIQKGLSSKTDYNENLEKERHRIKSAYRIEKLILLYEATTNLYNQVYVNQWRGLLGKKQKDPDMGTYIEYIKEATGVEIKTAKDLGKLKDKIQWWVSKYKQNFEQESREGITFMQIVMGVFSALNRPMDYKMYLSDFFILKEEAEKLSKHYGRFDRSNNK